MITRRGLIRGSTSAVAAALASRFPAIAQAPAFETPLPIPELVDARARGGLIEIAAAPGRHAFLPGRPTGTYGFSRSYLGPVLRLHRGDEVEIAVTNGLDRITTVHWHGVLVPAAVDGGPHLTIRPGETWRPVLRIDQGETTGWYHAHPHLDTGRQVYLGLAGMIVVEDGTGERLGLPRRYGIDDLPIILQDRAFDGSGALVYSAAGPSRMVGMRGGTLLVNGVGAPVARIPNGIVRLRVLNATNARNFDLRFADGRSLHVIGSDGGYLAAAVPLPSLRVAPGERFEVLVDFSQGGEAVLETGADDGAGMMGMMGAAASGAGPLMRFDVDPALPTAPMAFPAALSPLPPPDAARAVRRRRISLDMSMMMGPGGGMGRGGEPALGINGRAFDMGRIDFEVALGSTEIWEVVPNMMAHPFHIHGVTFRVLSIGGRPPAPHLAGEKDTILLDVPAELLMTFTQPATPDFPFMFHCHILEHEDGGMMGQYASV